MDTGDTRYAALLARCTAFAREHFGHLKDHNLLSEVMTKLEAIPGQLYATDIQQAFYEAVKERADEELSRR